MDIDKEYTEYVKTVKFPDDNEKWRDYVAKMWAVAFTTGAEFALKAVSSMIDKAEQESKEGK